MAKVFLPDSLLLSLIEDCQRQNRRAQRSFYEHYHGFAMATCMRYISNKADAVECMNDGFFKIFHAISGFHSGATQVDVAMKKWMRRIMVNTCIDRLRKHQLHTVDFDVAQEFVHANNNPYPELTMQEILTLIGRLSPGYRTIFNLFVIDGFTHEEIAHTLGITVGGSKSSLNKARRNLQHMIHQQNLAANYAG